jgi:hypothetical protein
MNTSLHRKQYLSTTLKRAVDDHNTTSDTNNIKTCVRYNREQQTQVASEHMHWTTTKQRQLQATVTACVRCLLASV